MSFQMVELSRANRAVLESIYADARANGVTPDLRRRDLTESILDGFVFRSDTVDEFGFFAKLIRADFRSSTLTHCDFSQTDCSNVNFRATDLTGANFRHASLYGALMQRSKLTGADLSYANLHSCELIEVKLDGVSFEGARFGHTTIAGVDLSVAEGLDRTIHRDPTALASDCLRMTADSLSRADEAAKRKVIVFLKNAGLAEDLLDAFRSWIGRPISFHSVFLSHSSLDKPFARQLHADLHGAGIDCWFDEKELLPGDLLLDAIDRGIRVWDKLLLVCSEHSLSARTGWWVEQEVTRALQKERETRLETGTRDVVLIPITIDDTLFSATTPLSATLLERYVGDFRGWHDKFRYQGALNSLIAALKTSKTRGVR